MARPDDVLPHIARFATRTPTLPPATDTNSYALGSRQILLVEPATPYEDEQRAWHAWADGLRSRGQEIVGIFATHHHPDHIGGASDLAEALGVPLWAHPITADLLPEVRFERLLEDGETIALDGPTPQRWRALHTPGHAPGHLCLLEETLGVAVVGDMVASIGTILIDPVEGDLIAYLDQLARLEALSPALALPAHGSPIERPSQLFRHYIEHRLGRERKVVAAFGQATATTLDGLVPHAYADTPPAIWPLAKLSLHAHLIKLERDGRATRHGDAWQLS